MPRGGKRLGAGRKKRATAAAPVKHVTPVEALQVAVPPIENPHNLSPKELLFVECYTGVSKFNATDAHERAGFKRNRHNAARLITKENVSKAIAERLGARLRTLQMDGDEALEGISRIGRADIRKVLDGSGNIRSIDSLDDDTADAIQSIKVVERRVATGNGKETEVEYTKEFKFYDKLRARELMAKAAGKLSDFGALKGAKGQPLVPRRVIIELDDATAGPA